MKNHTNDTCEQAAVVALDVLPAELMATLAVIGGKWKLLILWQLSQRDMRFGELRRALPRVTQHMLTTHLRELEADGMITRTVYAEVPPRVVYAATDHGRSLDTVLRALYEWGAGHLARQTRHAA